MEIAEFLLARIAEDEAAAMAAITNGEGALDWADAGDPTDVHIARWDPARVLAECDAKRRIVAHYEGDQQVDSGTYACKFLALPYADHPDYQQEWKP